MWGYPQLHTGNMFWITNKSRSSHFYFLRQLGISAGNVYVSVKSVGKTESSRTSASYAAVSAATLESNVTIVNNTGINDTMTVIGLAANDLVKVYASNAGESILSYATVASGSTQAVSVKQSRTSN